MYLVDVIIEHPIRHLDMTFTYLSSYQVYTGVRVHVPFGRQQVVGYVKKVEHTILSQDELEKRNNIHYKWITDVIDPYPILNQELNLLCDFLAKSTFATWISCIKTMLPPSLKPSSNAKTTLKIRKYVSFVKMGDNLTIKQYEFLKLLQSLQEIPLKDSPVSSTVLKTLEKKGNIEIVEKEIYREVVPMLKIEHKEVQLNSSQQQVLETLNKGDASLPYLLFGITGSGKTEIYLHATKHIIQQGKQVLMLVPEIALTPKMVALFKDRFQDDVAILHSRLSQGQRYDEYRRIASQEVKIVVGARSAIFAPLQNIGLIIMDEEHDASYKQNNVPYYHTKDIALWRARYHQAKVLLGSASPSIESFARAKANKYRLLEMTERATNTCLADFEIVDMSKEAQKGNLSYFSEAFRSGLNHCIQQGKQALILVNRRGYATYLLCKECGYIPKCPHCDVSLTYHKQNHSLECHYCGYQIPYAKACPSCKSEMVGYKGVGTERMEEALLQEFPELQIIRYDVDTTKNKAGHEKLLQKFENREANVLLGTQMIAKGLDFKDVTFVGVLDGDGALSIPDFRSAERTFQLMLQVAGRAGRHQKGHVVIQTFNPSHYAIYYGARQDYLSFYNEEIRQRKIGKYPPYCYLLSILVSGENEELVALNANQIAHYIQSKVKEVEVLGPATSMISKIKNLYRYRILIKYTKSTFLFDKIHQVMKLCDHKVKVEVDVNPYSQL